MAGFIVNTTDLDNIFRARVTDKRADVGYITSAGVDISNLYEKSNVASDQISYDTAFNSGVTDLKGLFQRAGYTPFTDTLSFGIVQFSGDCWQIWASGPRTNLLYRILFRVSGSKTKDFIPSTTGTKIYEVLNQGSSGMTFFFDRVQLLNNTKTAVLATWDVEKSFYTGSDINGNTARAFTIANTPDQGGVNATYTLINNKHTTNAATADFTLVLNSNLPLV
jgi:hypothetical protein